MQIETIITALIVLGIVWGGLVFFVCRALKYESLKSKNGKD